MLAAFAPIAEARGDAARADRWRGAHAERCEAALERHGWDGDWYRRAYFDDGTPLGSASNAECRIDSIAQSWSVLSGARRPGRARRGRWPRSTSTSIRRGDGLVLLFTPPFDHADARPRLHQGYLPGVRENGGQYTHAAIWSVLAFAALGDGDKAGELFSILNPINHASTRAGVHRYKVEPYVMAADVYAEPPHDRPRRLDLVHRLGRLDVPGRASSGSSASGCAARRSARPVHPATWPGYEIAFRYHTAAYEIVVENPHGVSRGVATAELDGRTLEGEGGEGATGTADPARRRWR